MFAAFIALVLAAPALVLLLAFVRALALFWPTMLMLGAVHSYIPAVPSLGWSATFFVVALLSLLIPTTSNTNTSTKS